MLNNKIYTATTTTQKAYTGNTGNLIKTLKGHTSDVLALEMIPDGTLASGSCDGVVKIWNLSTNQQLKI